MKFLSKPVEIDAEQFTDVNNPPRGMVFIMAAGKAYCDSAQGRVNVYIGDWIIKEPLGDGYYPCNPDVFAAKYEKV